jgi:predicted RNA-binding protein
MCLARVYIRENNNDSLIMETVSHIQKKNGKLLLKTILRQEKEVEADIDEIDLTGAKIILKPRK